MTYDTVFTKVFKFMALIVIILLAFIILMVVADVTMRWLFNRPFPATIEIIRLSLPCICFLPLAYTLVQGKHINVTAIPDRMPIRFQHVCNGFINALGFIYFSIITYWSLIYFLDSFAIREMANATIPLPWYVGKFALFLGSLLITFAFLNEFILILRKNKP